MRNKGTFIYVIIFCFNVLLQFYLVTNIIELGIDIPYQRLAHVSGTDWELKRKTFGLTTSPKIQFRISTCIIIYSIYTADVQSEKEW